MKIKSILSIGALAGGVLAMNVRAATVDFGESASDPPILIIGASGWLSGDPSFPTSESASFTGILNANVGAGAVSFLLFEGSFNGPLSDYVTVAWATPAGANQTTFTFNFVSDTDGAILQPPPEAAFPVAGRAVEDGTMQHFDLPPIAAGLPMPVTVGMQSDVESSVPDGGATLVLLTMGFGSLAVMRRAQKTS